MANPNPFLFGGPPADNPFMDAGAGMGDVNPFMTQAAPMMAGYDPYSAQHYGAAMAMHQQADAANPFGDYSGYTQQPNMMGYGYQQAADSYYGQQMAHINTNTHSVASNAMPYPAVSVANAGAAIFDVAHHSPALDGYGESAASSVYSPPDANPFLSSVQATPQSAMSSQSCTPAPFNPFADDAVEETPSQPEENTAQDTNQTLEDTGMEASATTMLGQMEITEAKSSLVDIDPSDSETVSLAGEEVKQILQKTVEAAHDSNLMAVPEVTESAAPADEASAEVSSDQQESGFCGIFTSGSLGPTTDSMQVATSHVDLYSETNEAEDKEIAPKR
jgi:hypothetical protein